MTTRTARPATVDDADEVVRLAALMYASIGMDPNATWRAAARQALVRRLEEDDAAVFVVDAPDAARLVASAAVTVATRLPSPNNPSARVGYVQWVATDADHRGRGHGRAVMEAVLAWLAARGVYAVELHATSDGEPLYRSMGFAESDHVGLRRRVVPS